MQNYSDEKLIIDYLKGKEKSLEILIKRYLRPIYGFVYRYVHNKQEAEDITQEVFIKMWRNLKTFDKSKNFRRWIFAVAKNTAFDFLKKKKAVQFSDLEKKENALVENFSGQTLSPDELLEKKDMMRKFMAIISGLLPKYREVLLLRHSEDLSFREISKRLNEPLNTVKSRYRRGLIMLKNFFLN